jgi:hypothetical protein
MIAEGTPIIERRLAMPKSVLTILLLLAILLVCAMLVGHRMGITGGITSAMQSGGPAFTWRNYFRSPPIIKQQLDAPLVIQNPTFHSHWSWSLGSLTILKHDVVNVSQKAIHSFSMSQDSGEPWGPGAIGSQPESPLKPGETLHTGVSVSGKSRVTLMIDFVQFADGTTWYSGSGQKSVHPDGVRAGARAAAEHLINVLESAGPEAVLAALPRIRADLNDSMANREVWGFGFYCGVTQVSVKVQHANQQGGLSAIEGMLRRILNETNRSP